MTKNTRWNKCKTFTQRIGTNYDRPTWSVINSLINNEIIISFFILYKILTLHSVLAKRKQNFDKHGTSCAKCG